MKERKRVIKRQIHRHTEGQTYRERERERERKKREREKEGDQKTDT